MLPVLPNVALQASTTEEHKDAHAKHLNMVDCYREEYTHHPRLLPEKTVAQSISCPTQLHSDEYRVASED